MYVLWSIPVDRGSKTAPGTAPASIVPNSPRDDEIEGEIDSGKLVVSPEPRLEATND